MNSSMQNAALKLRFLDKEKTFYLVSKIIPKSETNSILESKFLMLISNWGFN